MNCFSRPHSLMLMLTTLFALTSNAANTTTTPIFNSTANPTNSPSSSPTGTPSTKITTMHPSSSPTLPPVTTSTKRTTLSPSRDPTMNPVKSATTQPTKTVEYILGEPITLTIHHIPNATFITKINIGMPTPDVILSATVSPSVPVPANGSTTKIQVDFTVGYVSGGSLFSSYVPSYTPISSGRGMLIGAEVDHGASAQFVAFAMAENPIERVKRLSSKILKIDELSTLNGHVDVIRVNHSISRNLSDPRLWVYQLAKADYWTLRYNVVASATVITAIDRKSGTGREVYLKIGNWSWINGSVSGDFITVVGVRKNVSSNELRYISTQLRLIPGSFKGRDWGTVFIEKSFGLRQFPQSSKQLSSMNLTISSNITSSRTWGVYVTRSDNQSYMLGCTTMSTQSTKTITRIFDWRTGTVDVSSPRNTNQKTVGGKILPPGTYSVYLLAFDISGTYSPSVVPNGIRPGIQPYQLVQSGWIVKPSSMNVVRVNASFTALNTDVFRRFSVTIQTRYSPVMIKFYYARNSTAPYIQANYQRSFPVAVDSAVDLNFPVPLDILDVLANQKSHALYVRVQAGATQCDGTTVISNGYVDFQITGQGGPFRPLPPSTNSANTLPVLVIVLIAVGGFVGGMMILFVIQRCCKKQNNQQTNYQTLG